MTSSKPGASVLLEHPPVPVTPLHSRSVLPEVMGWQSSRPPVCGETQSRAPRNVLIVESHPCTRRVLRETLECGGYQVSEARDGWSALDQMAVGSPHLVLMNLTLPDLEASDLVRYWNTLPGASRLPLVAFSGSLELLSAARRFQPGFRGFLAKPFLPSQLLQTLYFYERSRPQALATATWGERVSWSSAQSAQRWKKLFRLTPVQGRRVMVVDDNPLQREQLAECLCQLGFQVTAADNGVDALELALRCPPEVIVVDTLMPGCDGYEFCLTVHQLPRLAEVPVLLSPAGHAEEVDRLVAQNLGAHDFPLRTPDFAEVLDSLLAVLSGQPPRFASKPRRSARVPATA